jgi:hypothetical protein
MMGRIGYQDLQGESYALREWNLRTWDIGFNKVITGLLICSYLPLEIRSVNPADLTIF